MPHSPRVSTVRGRLNVFRVMLFLGVVILQCRAAVADFDWIDPAGGTFNDDANWSSNLTPGNLDPANFNIANSYTVVFNNSPTTASLMVGGSDVLFVTDGTARTYTVTGTTSILGSDLTLAAPGPLLLSTARIDVSPSRHLTVSSGNEVSAGILSLAADMSATGTGSVVVDGPGSAFSISGATVIGSFGNVGNLTFQNSAHGSFNSITTTNSGISSSGASILVQSGADLLVSGDMSLGTGSQTGQVSTFTVSGSTAKVDQTGATTLTIGAAANSSSDLTLLGGAQFITGTGLTTINATGHLNIAGNYSARGDMLINGGTFARNSGTFTLAPGKFVTALNIASISFTGSYVVGDNSTFTIQSGADLSTTTFLDVGSGSTGTLIIDGNGSTLNTGSNPIWGFQGTANVTIRNGATATVNSSLGIAISNLSGTSGNLTVQTGATMSSGSLSIASSGGITTTGTVTVADPGSSYTLTGSSSFTLGHASTGSATLNVNNGGVFTSGTGNININATGRVNINGGIFNANGNVNLNSAALFTSSGTLNAGNGGTTGILSGGTLQNNGQVVFNRSNSASITTAITGSGSLIHAGSGTTTLTGLYSGIHSPLVRPRLYLSRPAA